MPASFCYPPVVIVNLNGMQNFWFGAELVFNCELLEGYGKWEVRLILWKMVSVKLFLASALLCRKLEIHGTCLDVAVSTGFTCDLYPLLTLAFDTFSF